MTTQVIVVEDLADWRFGDPGCPVIHADDYLTGREYHRLRHVQVINLCRGFKYLSVGYYCSLLAEARRHRVVPSVKSILDLSSKAMYGLDTGNLDEAMEKAFRRYKSGAADGKSFPLPEPPDPADGPGAGETELRMEVFFGHCRYPPLEDLARQLFETFPAPLLRVTFTREDRWRITALKPLAVNRLGKESRELFGEALNLYLRRRWRAPKAKVPARYDLAILHNPADPQPPSDAKALRNFIKAGQGLGLAVELIERKDYGRLAEYDALFIRDTTRINHYTYRFAKKAESEGMVVIDDPRSILRCTNKVYLAELLRASRVPTPRTVIAAREDLDAMEKAIGYPMVLKVPDGSFSQGVVKAEDRAHMLEQAGRLLEQTELILAQEFLYTEFDWRIGILNREPLYACQYFMSKSHWQIVHYDSAGGFTEGHFKTWPIEQVPHEVVSIALKAANLIGDGFYGVDLKQGRDGVYVIEVNDNPSVESGVEDGYLKDRLYRAVMAEFLRRLEARRVR